MKITDVIKKPLITEKSSLAQQSANQYVFAVERRATKNDIRNAVEGLFKVKVVEIKTMVVPGKYKRVGKNVGKAADWKKAVVKLAENNQISFAEGV
ncbi:MAG TPA: 50S ribosomal protein L23 [bacterium]|nr:50S ribosomal protein L23 [Myxococcales bacterium]OQA58632.1 MAG: 50S ribosomal protein L23 [bacterium ADurb.Bin270]HPW45378.1 50S ribosomal protein L23 [bacterium]HQG13499.1 50S ribosomal protein L23 [bacterium]HQH80212.1 50S ribosomal protein L23 [bacterium]